MAQENLARNIMQWSKKIAELNNSVSSENWREFEKPVFIDKLNKGISELEQISGMMNEIREDIEKQPLQNSPDCAEITDEFSKTIQLLKKNLELEQAKKASKAKEINVLEKDTLPELYSSLQQKIISLLLKSRHMNERLAIFARKQTASPLPEKSTGKQLMELLEQREQEIQELKGKYSEIRKKSFLGLIEEKTVADAEYDVAGIEKKIIQDYSILEHSLENTASQLETMQAVFADSKQKLSSIREALEQYSEKSAELSKHLKKERDFAKKLALDLESETLQLRNSYTSGMLNLNEEKLSAKKEAEAKTIEKISALKKELEDKNELLERFKKISEDKLEKEKQLEEKVKQLTLLLKAKEKHDEVKAQFQKRAKEKQEN